MDKSPGIQIPAGLLPAVTEFQSGELVMICVHRGTDKNTVRDYLLRIEDFAKQSERMLFFANELDDMNPLHSASDERAKVRELRMQNENTNIVTIIVQRYPPRFMELQQEADVSFHLLPGYRGINVEFGKCRRLEAQPQPHVIAVQSRNFLMPARLQLHTEDSIVIEVIGSRPRDGKSSVAIVMAYVLERMLRGTDKKVRVAVAEGTGFPVNKIASGELLREIGAKEIVIVDGNRNLQQWRAPPLTHETDITELSA